MATRFFHDLLVALARRSTRVGDGHASGPEDVDALIKACETLMCSDGEASSIGLAQSILERFDAVSSDVAVSFLERLGSDFGADRETVRRACLRYLDALEQSDDSLQIEEALQSLFSCVEPRRQELLRRLNLPPGGTFALVQMRALLLQNLRNHDALKPLNRDFVHLLGSWFNRGFLVMRRIDWNTPANVLEKLIAYESVHAIQDWNDLRRRLDSRDRRCFAFFHPALGDEPLVFLEVALCAGMPDRISAIINQQQPEQHQCATADTAAFFGISNCQDGLRGISLGNFLIKQVVEELKQECPQLRNFVTLSPVPGFVHWLYESIEQIGGDDDKPSDKLNALRKLELHDWFDHTDLVAELTPMLEPLMTWYLTQERDAAGRLRDPVARFHLRNGARLERVNLFADLSPKGVAQSAGVMVNYLYDLNSIEANHEAFVNQGEVIMAPALSRHIQHKKTIKEVIVS